MKRILPLICAAAVLAACGSGSNQQPAPTPTPAKSRLALFDADNFADGLNLPDFTEYWTLAEARNGNVYPVKAKLSDSVVLTARLDAAGKFAVRDGNSFREANLAALSAQADTLAQKHWNEEHKASAAAMILFADAAAPFIELERLCRELVQLQMNNLWLVTRDTREESLRLLPLKLDTTQLSRDWYGLDAEDAKVTLLFRWRRDGARKDFVSVRFNLPNPGGDLFEAKAGEPWRERLQQGQIKWFSRATRIQFDLPADGTLGEFAETANLMAPVGYDDVEPFWPVLDMPEAGPEVPSARTLATYTDEHGAASGLNLPTLSQWWRASAADRGLDGAGTLDAARPWVTIKAEANGSFVTRLAPGADWQPHGDDVDVLQVLRQNAGEVDLDTGLSELQVVVAMDRYANWETFLGVLEMVKSVGAFRLFVLTNDVVGPTFRLLQAHLPVGELPAEVASVWVSRESTVAEGKYTVTMQLDGDEHEVTGPRFSSSLARWSGERKADPKMLGIRLPRDEPFETLFTILDACAWLGAPALSFGG